jgi:hypothetical protein
MIYCQKCGAKNADEATVCAKCGETLKADFADGNERPLVQKLHQKENAIREKDDGAMSFIILGSIFIVIGILFFVLSFKLPYAAAVSKVLIVTCFEFWVALIALIGGSAALAYGLVVLCLGLRALKVLKKDIEFIRANKTARVPDEKPAAAAKPASKN